jgi:WD40 repeat protein
MIDKVTRSFILLTATVAFPQSGLLAAEPLPPRALARIGDHRFYHGPGLTCAALSPDGRRIASAAQYEFDTWVTNFKTGSSFQYTRHISDQQRDAYDPIIVLWDAATRERLRELRVPHAPIGDLAFSPDGKRLAVATSAIFDHKYGVFVFALETGKLLWQQDNFKKWLDDLHFSADGQYLSAGEWRGPVRLWEAATGKSLRIWKPPADEGDYGAESGLLSPDGKVVAWEINRISERERVAKSVGLRVQDAATDRLLYQMKLKPPYYLNSFAFSADGKRLAADQDGKFTVWETATGTKLTSLDVPEMTRFALSPDGQRAAIYEMDNSRLRVWDLKSGKPSQAHDFGNLIVGRLEFSSDGRKLRCDTASTLRLFDTATGKECIVPGHRAAVQCRFSSDGRTLFTSCDEKRCSWNIARGNEPALLTSELRKQWEFMCLAQSADDRLFLKKTEDAVRVCETATGRVLCKLENSGTKSLTGRERFEYAGDGLFSPDTTQVLIRYFGVEGERLRLYEEKTGKLSGEIECKRRTNPVFSRNGRLIACADGDDVRLHDSATWEVVQTLRSSQPFPKAKPNGARLLFSPDGEQLIVTTYHYDGSKPVREELTTLPTRVFQVSTGREIARFYANPEQKSKATRLSCVACSPDGRLLAVAEQCSGIVRLLEIASGKLRAELSGHRHGVHGLDFAPDGETLASGGEDNVVFLWDVTGARTSTPKPPHERDLISLWNDLASEDGQRAGAAIASLLRKSEASVAFLQERLHPAEALNEKQLTQWIGDLDADVFETRRAASKELAQLGERVEPALRRALRSRPSLEAKRRLEELLNKLELHPPSPETLRSLRAIEVLEHIGTPAARRCLE